MAMRRYRQVMCFAMALWLALPAGAEPGDAPLRVYAAGSLKGALAAAAAAFAAAGGGEVTTEFGPSGLLRERIAQGAPAEVFVSANLEHPQALVDAGRATRVEPFARNRLCALTRPGFVLTTAVLPERLLDPDVKLGTSTPKSDPAGDYAWQMFARAEVMHPGARAALEAKALQLTGGPDSPKPPAGRNAYAWLLEEGRADVFLSYCTNAVAARREVPGIGIVELPAGLAVGADYGLVVLDGARPAARRYADFLLGPEGRRLLAGFGFAAPASR